MFSIKNAVQLALMQTGVIVAGVLGAGTSVKVWKTMVDPNTVPATTTQLMKLGPLPLVIPLVWIVLVLVLRQRSDVSEDAKALGFGSGIIILIALIVAIGIVILGPWLGVDFGRHGDE